MARLPIAAITSIAMLSVAGPVARADNGPHDARVNNGSTTLAADSCGGCHRAHTASGSALIVAADEDALCLACHGSTAAGATTDVVDGVLAGTTRGLLGGGFVNAIMDTGWTGTATSRPSTSSHLFDGSTPGTLWGNGPIGSGTGRVGFTLGCTDCHNPHGNGAYRTLRPIPTGSGASSSVAVPDPATKVYTVASPLNRYFGEVYAGWGLEPWCAQCHTRYSAPGPDQATTDSGDAIYRYRHTTRQIGCLKCHPISDGRPFIPPNPYGISSDVIHRPGCEACHTAHGSAAQMGPYSGVVAWPDGATAPSGSGRSSLLRLDNRGMCIGCHDPTD